MQPNSQLELLAGDVAATKRLVDQVMSRHGPIDVLVVNAGIGHFAPFTEVDEIFFDTHFSVNVRGAFFLLKHAAPAMRDGGSIILVGSVFGLMGGGSRSIYASTKAAVRSFGRTFATELVPRGIRVNTISPGPTDTPITAKSGLPPEQIKAVIESFVASIPLGRRADADEVARSALFLASADSSFMTGAELVIDGGMASH